MGLLGFSLRSASQRPTTAFVVTLIVSEGLDGKLRRGESSVFVLDIVGRLKYRFCIIFVPRISARIGSTVRWSRAWACTAPKMHEEGRA